MGALRAAELFMPRVCRAGASAAVLSPTAAFCLYPAFDLMGNSPLVGARIFLSSYNLTHFLKSARGLGISLSDGCPKLEHLMEELVWYYA